MFLGDGGGDLTTRTWRGQAWRARTEKPGASKERKFVMEEYGRRTGQWPRRGDGCAILGARGLVRFKKRGSATDGTKIKPGTIKEKTLPRLSGSRSHFQGEWSPEENPPKNGLPAETDSSEAKASGLADDSNVRDSLGAARDTDRRLSIRKGWQEGETHWKKGGAATR